jgi:hypothetical protein
MLSGGEEADDGEGDADRAGRPGQAGLQFWTQTAELDEGAQRTTGRSYSSTISALSAVIGSGAGVCTSVTKALSPG